MSGSEAEPKNECKAMKDEKQLKINGLHPEEFGASLNVQPKNGNILANISSLKRE